MGFKDRFKKLLKSDKNSDGEFTSRDNNPECENIEKRAFDNAADNCDEMNCEETMEEVHGESRNFRYLDDLIHSGADVIVLDSDIVLEDAECPQYLDGIRLDVDDLVIDGRGHSIDACFKTRIFHCTSKATLKNLTLKNASNPKNGGAIANDGGELSIIDSTFHANRSAEFGGAISNGGVLNVCNSGFCENHAVSGGAIYSDGELTMGECRMEGNECDDFGGALWNSGDSTLSQSLFNCNRAFVGGAILNSSNLTISQSKLTNNSSQRDAGAIMNASGELTIVNCELLQNETGYLGGAIYNFTKGVANISDSVISENANGHGFGHDDTFSAFRKIHIRKKKYLGGAIANDGNLTITESAINDNRGFCGGAIGNTGEMEIIESNINENRANFGGGIFNLGKTELTKSALDTNYSMLTNFPGYSISDTARNWISVGGAIFNGGEMSVHESKMCRNGSSEFGGALFNEGKLTISESRLSLNESLGDGVAIYNSSNNLSIHDSEISQNGVRGYGEAAIVHNRDSMQIYNTDFKDNQSLRTILNDGDESNLYLFNCRFEYNVWQFIQHPMVQVECSEMGSVISNRGKSCTIERTLFENDCMNILNRTNLTLIAPKINDKGRTICNLGRIRINLSDQDILDKIDDDGTVEIKSRRSGEKFDFTYLDEEIRKFQGKEFILNEDITFEVYEDDFYEGGIELDIDGFVFNGNGHVIDAAGKSRIFLITGDNITLKNVTFKNGHSFKSYNNLPNSNGGALKINHDLNLKITDCKFIANGSESNGGAIYNDGELNVAGSVFDENSTNCRGGAIFNMGFLTISKSELLNNSTYTYEVNPGEGGQSISEFWVKQTKAARHRGGAINNQGRLVARNSSFINNKSNMGGAIFSTKSQYDLADCTYEGNSFGDVRDDE